MRLHDGHFKPALRRPLTCSRHPCRAMGTGTATPHSQQLAGHKIRNDEVGRMGKLLLCHLVGTWLITCCAMHAGTSTLCSTICCLVLFWGMSVGPWLIMLCHRLWHMDDHRLGHVHWRPTPQPAQPSAGQHAPGQWCWAHEQSPTALRTCLRPTDAQTCPRRRACQPSPGRWQPHPPG